MRRPKKQLNCLSGKVLTDQRALGHTCPVKDMLILSPVHLLKLVGRFGSTSPPSHIHLFPTHGDPFRDTGSRHRLEPYSLD